MPTPQGGEMISLNDLRPGMYIQNGKTLYKVSTVYPATSRVTLQEIYPKPTRTTVRTFTSTDIALCFKFPSDATIRKAEEAYA